MSRRDQLLAQGGFYSGARCVLRVLDYLAEEGDIEELQRVVRRHGRTIRVLQGQAATKAQPLTSASGVYLLSNAAHRRPPAPRRRYD
jgi:alkylated DNA nucleotide flippase Atl1